MIDLCGEQAKNWGWWSSLSFNAARAHCRPPASSEAGWLSLAACGDLGKPDLAGHNNKGWGRVEDPVYTRPCGQAYHPCIAAQGRCYGNIVSFESHPPPPARMCLLHVCHLNIQRDSWSSLFAIILNQCRCGLWVILPVSQTRRKTLKTAPYDTPVFFDISLYESPRPDNQTMSSSFVSQIQWNLSITITYWDTSLPSGAHLGGQGAPRWAPEGRNCKQE